MFQFSQIAETLSGLLGGQNPLEQAPTEQITNLLSESGIDLSALEGLGADQIMEIAQNAGVDLGQFSPDQITEVIQNFNVGGLMENVDLGAIAENIFKR